MELGVSRFASHLCLTSADGLVHCARRTNSLDIKHLDAFVILTIMRSSICLT